MPKPKVYCTIPGHRVMIQGYGYASEDEPVEVPESVARDVETNKELRVERPAPPKKPKLKKAEED